MRLLAPHLTADNHRRVLAAARDKRKTDIEHLVASLRSKPPAVVRKLTATDRVASEGSSSTTCDGYADGGPATVANIQLRCSAHNAYEASLFFGSQASVRVLEARSEYGDGHAWTLQQLEDSRKLVMTIPSKARVVEIAGAHSLCFCRIQPR